MKNEVKNPVIASQSQAVTDLNKKFPPHGEIARKAYFIYLRHGCQDGHDVAQWLDAEKQLIVEHDGPPRPEGVTS